MGDSRHVGPEDIVRELADGHDEARLDQHTEPGHELCARRDLRRGGATASAGPCRRVGHGRDDVPENHATFEAELGQHIVDYGRGGIAPRPFGASGPERMPPSQELALGGDGTRSTAKAPVAT